MASTTTAINKLTGQPYSPNCAAVRARAARLPVSQKLDEVQALVLHHTVVILEGETGSGKTTQVAHLTADRLAEEMDVEVGGIVGVRYKGVDKVSNATRLAVVTDGSLVAAVQRDPTLDKYNVIIVDEAHQHTVHTDLLLGILKDIIKSRQDLKIIIMSASLDAELLENFFPGAARLVVPSKPYGVCISYLPEPPVDLDDAIVDTILQIHLTHRSGDILVFVSSVDEITKIILKVKQALSRQHRRVAEDTKPLECYALYAS
ncbi:hypothetical protein LTR08_001649 [Meristemomyces frigidus]|nr:hypothetical protein LTR08_001649 [Meristemomyces frigidus]